MSCPENPEPPGHRTSIRCDADLARGLCYHRTMQLIGRATGQHARDRGLPLGRKHVGGIPKEAVEFPCVLAPHLFDFVALQKIQAAGFRSSDLLAPNRIVDPAPDGAFQFGSLWKLIGLGHGFDLQDKRERPPASDAKVAGPKATNKHAREAESRKTARPFPPQKPCMAAAPQVGRHRNFRLPWTLLVDHRMPEFRAVDLMRWSGSAISESGWGTRIRT